MKMFCRHGCRRCFFLHAIACLIFISLTTIDNYELILQFQTLYVLWYTSYLNSKIGSLQYVYNEKVLNVGSLSYAYILFVQSTGISEELQYSISRLVKGLASSRQSARHGFSVALCQVKSHYVYNTWLFLDDQNFNISKYIKSSCENKSESIFKKDVYRTIKK